MVVLQGVSTDLAGLLANGVFAGIGDTKAPAIAGGAGNETLPGTPGSDLMLGLAGNDSLSLSGSDQVPEGFRQAIEEYYRSLAKKQPQK